MLNRHSVYFGEKERNVNYVALLFFMKTEKLKKLNNNELQCSVYFCDSKCTNIQGSGFDPFSNIQFIQIH